MVTYRLSERADKDLESIYLYGLVNFGQHQADAYADGMEARFEQIGSQPLSYPAVDHIRPGYRCSVYGRHSIYFRFESRLVIIVRILHRQDLGKAFD